MQTRIDTPVHMRQLAQTIRAVESQGGRLPGAARLATGWGPVDAAMEGGLMAGVVHEWISGGGPALGVFIHLARQAVMNGPAGGGEVVWIGRSCRPYARALEGAAGRALRERSLLIDPPDDACRLWAIDLAARSAAVAMVIADGRGLGMAGSRRLQLAAREGGSWLLLARSETEAAAPSVAATRWRVTPCVTTGDRPRWRMDLLRCKGMQSTFGTAAGARTWHLEWNHETHDVVASADVVDRSGPADSDGTARKARTPRKGSVDVDADGSHEHLPWEPLGGAAV